MAGIELERQPESPLSSKIRSEFEPRMNANAREFLTIAFALIGVHSRFTFLITACVSDSNLTSPFKTVVFTEDWQD